MKATEARDLPLEDEGQTGTITAKAWDVVICENNHPCLLVIRPFQLEAGHIPYNSNFLCIDGGENLPDGLHWGSFRCRRCGKSILMDEQGFRLRIRKS
jgi:hypothetical protein